MNILWNPNEAVDLIEMPLPLITEGTQDMGDGVYWLKAGTPLDEYFAVANDEDAKYVVAEDFYFISSKPDQAKVVPLITSGYVDINKAEKAAGITYSQDCIDALADEGIVLVDGTLPSSGGGGGGGGGGVLVAQIFGSTLDKTWQEIHDAMLAGGAVVFFPVVGKVSIVTAASYSPKAGQYFVESATVRYVTSTADGYPTEQTE
jgi:hypothetical protein